VRDGAELTDPVESGGVGGLVPSGGIRCLNAPYRLCDIGSDVLVLCGKRIEIDELWIVRAGLAVGPFAAMKVNQGLHTPGIQIVDMLMPQRDRQQHFWKLDQRECWNPARFTARPPKQRIEGVN